MIIEINYTTDDDEMPEHYAYCDSVDEAFERLEELRGLENAKEEI